HTRPWTRVFSRCYSARRDLLSFPTRRSSDLALIFVFPLYWRVVSSLRPDGRIFVDAFELFPSQFSLDSYRSLFEQEPFGRWIIRSEEHTSELQSRENLVCRLLLEKKNPPSVL